MLLQSLYWVKHDMKQWGGWDCLTDLDSDFALCISKSVGLTPLNYHQIYLEAILSAALENIYSHVT